MDIHTNFTWRDTKSLGGPKDHMVDEESSKGVWRALTGHGEMKRAKSRPQD